MITVDQIKKIVPAANMGRLELFVPYLNVYMPAYDISTPLRIVGFIPQILHESGSFSRLEENLNYSAKRLLKVFPNIFPTLKSAVTYAMQPISLANLVYANKGGNGGAASGDGWKFRGRGAIQITLKDNYERASEDMFHTDILLKNPDLLLQPAYAIESACWYWKARGLNAFADKRDFATITKRINAASEGKEKRLQLYNQAKKILNVK